MPPDNPDNDFELFRTTIGNKHFYKVPIIDPSEIEKLFNKEKFGIETLELFDIFQKFYSVRKRFIEKDETKKKLFETVTEFLKRSFSDDFKDYCEKNKKVPNISSPFMSKKISNNILTPNTSGNNNSFKVDIPVSNDNLENSNNPFRKTFNFPQCKPSICEEQMGMEKKPQPNNFKMLNPLNQLTEKKPQPNNFKILNPLNQSIMMKKIEMKKIEMKKIEVKPKQGSRVLTLFNKGKKENQQH
jgi:hypothetical protein